MTVAPLVCETTEIDQSAVLALRSRAHSSGRVLERDGLLVVGLGVAVELGLPTGLADPTAVREAVAALAAIEGAKLAASNPVAAPIGIGALPFDREAPGVIVVPEIAVVSAAGQRPQAILVGRPERLPALRAQLASSSEEVEPIEPGTLPDAFDLASTRSHDDFLRRVAAAVGEIRAGHVDKVVLAREVTVRANRPLVQRDLLGRLRSLHPSCLTFAVDGFIGATPELLLRRRGPQIASHPLAGTAARSGDAEADRRVEAALLASDKERSEHRAVVDTIVAALSPLVEQLTVPDRPEILELRNVSHLGTPIAGLLAMSDRTLPSALDLVALLHPTPAVAGTPLQSALECLAKLEDLDRDRYAGPVGWVDAAGDGEWHVGLRCALVDGSVARLFAGVGIVADSDPAAELAETQLKLQAFLAAAVRP